MFPVSLSLIVLIHRVLWFFFCDTVEQACGGKVFAVRLDLFHALKRISRVIKKKHGAFRPFMARLRDACFLINKDDIEQLSTTGAICAALLLFLTGGGLSHQFPNRSSSDPGGKYTDEARLQC